ncbi:hypothetical protein HB780_06025 (plasmid) [Rhizobium lusitanum]|uniref:hypothetical protein n=1 Tax=Rhizobium lusitanum TaxID=293958 RepID=UPI0016206FD9|nr:hypothetical protein [Rhizobium lusitanum]QND45306.1 hypothetical protein HB780_06025 [Rhizobium lusitanum]
MTHPQTGGSYRREKNGSLTPIAAPADVTPETSAEASTATELQAGQPAVVETPAEEETGGKKGKA